MTTPRKSTCFVLALGAAALMAAGAPTVAAAAAAPGGATARPCFLSLDWEGWSASADGDALYLRVRMHDIYRVELTPGSHVHKRSDEFLLNRVRGSSWICSPLDLDLMLSDHQGFRQPLIARSLRKLTPEEVAAIPHKELP
jgi:hypothetical protein